MSPSVDLRGGFCAGTPVAGTCVAAFLEPLAACFTAAGACTTSVPGTTCWANGAKVVFSGGSFAQNEPVSYSFDGTPCFTETFGYNIRVTIEAAGNAGTLVYDGIGGVATCPDGSRVEIGQEWGGCSAFGQLLGAAAVDRRTCSAGTCP